MQILRFAQDDNLTPYTAVDLTPGVSIPSSRHLGWTSNVAILTLATGGC